MMIIIKEVSLEEAKKIHNLIPEFNNPLNNPEECLKSPHLILAAYINNEPAGYLIAYDRYKDGSLYCWMTGVIPRFRQKGVLKALMNYQDDWAGKNSYTKIKIKTRNNRREMISYLIKNNFSFIGVIKKETPDENRILLEKDL